jgi:hypothetical protein
MIGRGTSRIDGMVIIKRDKAAADGALTSVDLLHGRTILLRRGRVWHATERG